MYMLKGRWRRKPAPVPLPPMLAHVPGTDQLPSVAELVAARIMTEAQAQVVMTGLAESAIIVVSGNLGPAKTRVALACAAAAQPIVPKVLLDCHRVAAAFPALRALPDIAQGDVYLDTTVAQVDARQLWAAFIAPIYPVMLHLLALSDEVAAWMHCAQDAGGIASSYAPADLILHTYTTGGSQRRPLIWMQVDGTSHTVQTMQVVGLDSLPARLCNPQE